MPSITIWTRLEPRCRTTDMAPALEARTHDPFWMLARQWQLGELLGDDAGSPIIAAIDSVDIPLDRYAGLSGSTTTMPTSTPLEAWVEREPVRPRGPAVDYRQSAEAGLHFVRLLRAANLFTTYGAAYVTQYAVTPPSPAERASHDAAALHLADVVARRVPDGVRLAAALRAAQPGLPTAPAIAQPDGPRVQQVANDFLAWYDALFDEPPDANTSGGAWVNARMEYQFTIDASTTDAPGAYVADRYTGEPLDWTSFDRSPPKSGTPTASSQAPVRTRRMIPSPVRFKGMPARRFWEIEEADVDLGSLEAGPADLGRLMLREFSLVYGNDWFLIPLPVQVGSVCHITSLVVMDTFGGSHTIPHYKLTADGGHWGMFAISGDTTEHRLLVPPVLARGLTSEPFEQVLLVRDEPANMAWGVERVVQGASGAPVDRVSTVSRPASQPPGGQSLHYQLGTSVPDYYIPFVPVSVAVDKSVPPKTQRRMQRAAFLRTDGTPGPIAPRGRFLAQDVALFEEEFPREGVRLERTYRLARWTDGSTHLWVARRKQTGATVGSSGLQFDRLETS